MRAGYEFSSTRGGRSPCAAQPGCHHLGERPARRLGRRPKFTPGQIEHDRELYAEDGKRSYTVAEIVGLLGVSRTTIYRVLDPDLVGPVPREGRCLQPPR